MRKHISSTSYISKIPQEFISLHSAQKHYAYGSGWELDDDEYVNLFKENLQSEGLIELFSALEE